MASYLEYNYQCKYTVEKQTRVCYEKFLIFLPRHGGEKPGSG